MRNLKRALSLTLASVMLLGMMVIGTSAASFTDADQISNVTAATVLQELEVMQGSNGKFSPNQTVTRGQMAILICKMLYGSKLNADNFAGTSQFEDVPANAYYTGYVNLASQLGIISGYGNGKFGPGAPVTTAQAALMLTRALGWFQAGELENQSWTSNAIAAVERATAINLFGDLKLSTNEPLSRDNVAEMVFNALTKTAPVNYNERWDMYYSDEGSIMSGVKFNYLNSLGYKNFTLVYTETDKKDDFGRPSVVWGIGNGTLDSDDIDTATGNILDTATVVIKDEIITSAKTADKVYVGEVKSKDIYNDLSLRTSFAQGEDGNLNIYVDSSEPNGREDEEIVKNREDANNKHGEDGQTVEVYYTKGATAAADEITMVITTTYLGIVTDDDYRQDNKDGIRVDVFGVGLKFFETDGYSEDDLVLVNLSDDEIKAIVGEPKTVKGEVFRVGNSDNALTLDSKSGTKYPQSIAFDAEADGDVIDGTDDFDVENTYTLYLDNNGCYLAAVLDEENATTDLVYVYDVTAKLAVSGSTGAYKPVATVVYMDGTYKDVPLGDKEFATSTDGDLTAAISAAGAWKNSLANLKYDEDDDVYTLEDPAGDYDVDDMDNDVELKTDSTYAKFDGATNTYLNSSTVYVFVTQNEDKDAIDSVKVVTGGVDFDFDATEMANSVFAVETDKHVGKYVVIMNEYEAAAKDVLYIKTGELKGKVNGGYTFEGYFNNDYDEYTAGKKVEVPVYSVWNADDEEYKAVTSDGTNGPAANTFYEYSEKSDGTLRLKPVSAPADEDKAGAILAQEVNSIEGSSIDVATGHRPYSMSGAQIIDLTEGKEDKGSAYGAEITTLTALRKVVNGDYTVTVDLYVNGDNKVEALFIKSVADAEEEEAAFPVVSAGTATVGLADTSTGNGKATAAATVEVGTLSNTGAADITVTLKSGGHTVANDDTIAFDLTCAGATIEGDEVSDGTLTLKKANNAWANSTVTVAKDGKTSTYTVKVTVASTDISARASTLTATAGSGSGDLNTKTAPSIGNGSDGAATITIASAGLTAGEGSKISFTVTVSNGTTISGEQATATSKAIEITYDHENSGWPDDVDFTLVAPAGNTVTYTISVS